MDGKVYQKKELDTYCNEIKRMVSMDNNRIELNKSLKDVERRLKIKKSKNMDDNNIDRKIEGVKHLRKGIFLLW